MRCFSVLLLIVTLICSSITFAQSRNRSLPTYPESMEVTLSLKDAYQRMDRIYTSAASMRRIGELYAVLAVREDNQLLLVQCSGGSQPAPDCEPMAQFEGYAASVAAVSYYGSRYGPKVWISTNRAIYVCAFWEKQRPGQPWKNCDKLADLPLSPLNKVAPTIHAAAKWPDRSNASIAWFALPKSLTGSAHSRVYQCYDWTRDASCGMWTKLSTDILTLGADMQASNRVDVWVTTPSGILRCNSADDQQECRSLFGLAPNAPVQLQFK